jgi:hypothetical protein
MSAFTDIPMRIFLDSSTLQTLQDYGGCIFEGEDLMPSDRSSRIRGYADELEALRRIMVIAERAPFEFVLSENSFAEVVERGDQGYVQWAYDVLDHWHACLDSYGESPFSGIGLDRCRVLDGSNSFGYLSEKDRALIRDAVELECDAFLTMERGLPTNAAHIERLLGLRVLRPSGMWSILKPWAALFV